MKRTSSKTTSRRGFIKSGKWNEHAIDLGLDELNPGWIRFGMPPDPHVDNEGNFIKGTVHFKHLERLNRWAVRKSRIILLDMFLMPRQ